MSEQMNENKSVNWQAKKKYIWDAFSIELKLNDRFLIVKLNLSLAYKLKTTIKTIVTTFTNVCDESSEIVCLI